MEFFAVPSSNWTLVTPVHTKTSDRVSSSDVWGEGQGPTVTPLVHLNSDRGPGTRVNNPSAQGTVTETSSEARARPFGTLDWWVVGCLSESFRVVGDGRRTGKSSPKETFTEIS